MKNIYLTTGAIFLIPGLFISTGVIAQENFSPGYIISLQGDTLKGLIDYRNWVINPKKVSFKEEEKMDLVEYTPLEINQFAVLDEIYESAIVEKEESNYKTSDLKYDKELILRKDTVFLQTMIQGPKSLYFLKSQYGNPQFYIKQEGRFVLLVYKRYLKKENGKKMIVENQKFLGQLIHYLQDCSSIQSKIKNTEYRQKSIESLFVSYYKCSESSFAFQKKTEKVSFKTGLFVGISSTSLEFNGNYDKYPLSSSEYPSSMNFTTSLFLDILPPRNNKKWSVRNEILFTSYKTEGSYKDATFVGGWNSTVINKFEYAYLKLNNLIRFAFPVKSLSFVASTGLSNGLAIHEVNERFVDSDLDNNGPVYFGKALNTTKKHELGLILGLGCKFKHYSIEARYENGTGISPYLDLSARAKRFYFMLGYEF